ncbi:MAG: hypothetical protein FH756_00530 [Firmicutes bacterium]|nr:hypothetical protein [Bacillota bacterium]
MAKLCPFRKKKFAKIVTAKNDEKTNTLEEWEEEFLECLEERCAAWTGNGCGRISVSSRPETAGNESNQKENTEESTQAGNNENGNKSGDLVKAYFKVLEAKETNTPGTVRAWCQHVESDKKGAVLAKNGAGKKLLESIGKQVQVKYRRMDNGTAYAVFVQAES